MAELSTWVSDKLHDVLGFSDKYTVEYLIGLAKSSASPESLVQRVSEGLNVDDKVASFASELWSKFPHATGHAEHPYRVKERALIEQRKKYMGYALLSDDEDDDKVIKTNESKKDRKRKHLRRKTESSSSDEDSLRGNDASKAIGNDSDSDEWEKEEEERKKDLEERDAFANRLKQKDKEKTRNILERSDKKVFVEKSSP